MGKQSLMVIGAHCDDIEGCYGATMFKYHEKFGYDILYVQSTNNMSGGWSEVIKGKHACQMPYPDKLDLFDPFAGKICGCEAAEPYTVVRLSGTRSGALTEAFAKNHKYCNEHWMQLFFSRESEQVFEEFFDQYRRSNGLVKLNGPVYTLHFISKCLATVAAAGECPILDSRRGQLLVACSCPQYLAPRPSCQT